MLVTATRVAQPVTDLTSDTLVISNDEIVMSGHRTLADLLQGKRGFELSRAGGPGAASSIFIRGAANSQSIVLIDGVRIGSATLGGATWEAIPLSQIDRVEVVYGPLASLYGADAMGGVVQIFTKQGDGAPRLHVQAGLGSYQARNLEAGIAGAGNGLRYGVQVAREKADGFSSTLPGSFSYNPDPDGYDKSSVGAQLSVELAKGHVLGANLLQSKLESQFDSGPGFNDRSEQRLGTTAVYAKNQMNALWQSTLQIARSTDKSKTFASWGNDSIDTTQNQFSWQNDVRLGRDGLQLVLERRVEKVDADTTELSRERSTNSLAGAYQWRRDAHLVNLALRNDDNSQYGSHSTGSAAYGYRTAGGWRFNASVGTSFRAPTFNELFYPGYGIPSNQPERGRNAELGLYYEQGTRELSAVVYRNRISDLLVYAPVCPVPLPTHTFGCAYNIDQAILEGISLAGSEKIAANLTLRGTLDLQDPHDVTTGKLLPRRARQHGSVGLEYAAASLKAGAEVVFSGERFDDGANRNRLGGYGLLNLYASHTFAPGWSVFGRWNNATDKEYALVRNYATPGSNVFVGVRYAMK